MVNNLKSISSAAIPAYRQAGAVNYWSCTIWNRAYKTNLRLSLPAAGRCG